MSQEKGEKNFKYCSEVFEDGAASSGTGIFIYIDYEGLDI